MKFFNEDYMAKIFIINSKTDDKLTLWANLIDIDITKKWIDVVNENNRRGYPLKSNYRRYKTVEEQEVEFEEFKDNIQYINDNYDKKLPELTTIEDLMESEYILNDLHEEFEVYGDRLEEVIESGYWDDPTNNEHYGKTYPGGEFAGPWPGDFHNFVLHESFLRLNEQIHNTETIIRRRLNPQIETSCTCLTDFLPNEKSGYIHVPLEPEDYMLFNPTIDWGWLYLGYNTLGKNWMSTSLDNDIAAVERDEIRPQQRFAAELFINLVPGYPNTTQVRLHKWWVENDFKKLKDPYMKLNEYCLGYIPLGQLYWYRENEGEMMPMEELWFGSKQDKINWNKEVWSKYDTVDSICIEKK